MIYQFVVIGNHLIRQRFHDGRLSDTGRTHQQDCPVLGPLKVFEDKPHFLTAPDNGLSRFQHFRPLQVGSVLDGRGQFLFTTYGKGGNARIEIIQDVFFRNPEAFYLLMRIYNPIPNDGCEHAQGIYRVGSQLYLGAFSLVQHKFHFSVSNNVRNVITRRNVHFLMGVEPVHDIRHVFLHGCQYLPQSRLFRHHRRGKVGDTVGMVLVLPCHSLCQFDGR